MFPVYSPTYLSVAAGVFFLIESSYLSAAAGVFFLIESSYPSAAAGVSFFIESSYLSAAAGVFFRESPLRTFEEEKLRPRPHGINMTHSDRVRTASK